VKKITLTLPDSVPPDLVLYQIPDGADDFVQKSVIDVVRSGSPTLVGVSTLEGSGKQSILLSFQVYVSEDEALLFDELKARQQSLYQLKQDGKITLRNERFYFSASEATKNQRVIIDTRNTTWGTKHYISYPVLLRIPENHTQQQADDLWLLSFDALELSS
jgi:hypothetical protein